MRKSFALLVGVAVLGTPALAQVRPQDCRPVFPLVDQVASLPQDVIAERAIPATVARRGFFGLPFLPLLLAGGGIALLDDNGNGNSDEEPVSPA